MIPERVRLDELIAEQFSASFMSDAKWVGLLNTLVEIGEQIEECRVKLVWDENVRQLCIDEYKSYDFDYYAHAMEAMISGQPSGWYAYKEIEWIEFTQPPHNLERIATTIQATGLFELKQTPQSLRLYAYR